MLTRAMIVVAAGASTRFGGDKLTVELLGKPVIAHTLSAVIPSVDSCILVCRHDMIRGLEKLGFECELIPGGPTRTASEMAGLAAVGPDIELIGIHDGARPGATPQLIEALFNRAAAVGGAVPALSPEGFAIERESKQVISDVVTVQTPQVFRAEVLRDAYACAAREGVSGQDTVELVLRFTDSRVTTVPGEETNMKITYPTDLTRVESALLDRADTGPR